MKSLELKQFSSRRDVYYLHEYRGVLAVLDHFLVSEQFCDHSKNRHWGFGELKVWTDHLEDNRPRKQRS